MPNQSYVCLSVVVFRDGTYSAQQLHEGDLVSCNKVAEMIPAITVSDPRPVDRAQLIVIAREDYRRAMEAPEASTE
jgi:hypothetical protein